MLFHIGISARIIISATWCSEPRPQIAINSGVATVVTGGWLLRPCGRSEDVQAGGTRCRENLIQFVSVLAEPEMVPAREEAPSGRISPNGHHWSTNTIAAGARNSYVRGHPKSNLRVSSGLGEL